jgi:hypothetical protein
MSGDAAQRLAEARIREAQARGEVDEPPAEGKPLDLDDLAGLKPEQRTAALLNRSLGDASPQAVLLREIREGRAALANCHDDAAREKIRAVLREKAAELSALWREQG